MVLGNSMKKNEFLTRFFAAITTMIAISSLITGYIDFPLFNTHLNWNYTNVKNWPFQNSELVVFQNKIWTNDGLNSTDGEVWNLVGVKNTVPPRTHTANVVFDNKLWTIGGNNMGVPLNDVWSSTDGMEWKKTETVTPFKAGDYQALVFRNKIWLLGGCRYSGKGRIAEIWFSDDGSKWTLSEKEILGHSNAIVYNDKIWEIGTDSGTWCSADGMNWDLVSSKDSFPLRGGFTAVSYHGAMWVIGGNIDIKGAQLTNRAWYSTDGINWNKACTFNSFPARWGPRSMIFNDKIWIIGGYKFTSGWYYLLSFINPVFLLTPHTQKLSDVWHSD
jgi:leucine-zipper-like transcriptional regulator 1